MDDEQTLRQLAKLNTLPHADIVRAVDRLLTDVAGGACVRGVYGPDHWEWIDSAGQRTFTVAPSATLPNVLLITIKLDVNRTLDTRMVYSTVLVGTDENHIYQAMTNAIVVASGAFAGLRGTLSALQEGVTDAITYVAGLSDVSLEDLVGEVQKRLSLN